MVNLRNDNNDQVNGELTMLNLVCIGLTGAWRFNIQSLGTLRKKFSQ